MTQDFTASDMESLEEGPEVQSLTDIYQELQTCGELILTIPAEEEEKLRKGLASVKAKQNAKLRDQGLPIDTSVLGFLSAPSEDFAGAMQITVTLAKRSGITILNKEFPDPTF